jgi:hypothetical protein
MAVTAEGSVTAESEPRRPQQMPRVRSVLAALGLDAQVIGAFAASRLLVLVAAFAAENLVIRNRALTSGDPAPLLKSLTSWDGIYYLGIAREGYHVAPVAGQYQDLAFPPLFPLVTHVLSLPWPAFTGLISVLVANVAALVGFGLLVRLGEIHLGRERAAIAAGLLAIYPFASAFAMAYSESLFLVLTVGAFLAAERDRRALAGILLALACLARLQGVVLVLPLAILFLRRDGWRPRASLLWLALGPAAVIGFMLYLASLTGSLTAYLDAQRAWGRQGIGGAPAGENLGSGLSPYLLALLLTLAWAIFMLVFVRTDRLRLEYALIPVLFIAAEMASGSLEAVGRVTMLAFPYAWILANRRSTFARAAWPAASAGLFAIIALLSFAGFWVP